jgi:hypothetical protein
MHDIHQISPANAKRHVEAIGYFFYDKVSVSLQAPLPPALSPYMPHAGGALLVAYQDGQPAACLSMQASGKDEALVDGLYFALEADARLAESLLRRAMDLAKQAGYQSLQAKRRALGLLNAGQLGFFPHAGNDRMLACRLSSVPTGQH